jgi:hypothetical protein
MTQHQATDESGEAIDFREIFNRLWQGRTTIALTCAVSLVLGVLYLHVAIYTYTASLVLVPTQTQGQNGISSQLGSLSSLVGIDFSNPQNVSPFTLYPDVMNSRVVGETFAARYPDLMHELFVDQWDDSRKSWRHPEGFMHDAIAAVKSIAGYPPQSWAPPSGADVQDVISKRVKTEIDNKKPIITVTFSHRDPLFARRFLQALHESTDLVLRRQTLDRSTKYSHYLEQELKKEHQADLRQVLISSFSQQEMLMMMSSSSTPFAAQPIGGAVSSMRPTSPKPIFVLLAAIAFGLFCGGSWEYFGLPRPRALFLRLIGR